MIARVHHRPRHLGLALLACAALATPLVGAIPAGAGPKRPLAVCTIQVNDDSYSTPENTALTVDDPGVVSNDDICDTDGLVISTSSPAHGTLSGFDDSGGGFTYTPDPGFTGTDSFTYVLEDVEESPTATVTITVTAPSTTTSTSTTLAPTTTVAPTTTAAAVAAEPAFTG